MGATATAGREALSARIRSRLADEIGSGSFERYVEGSLRLRIEDDALCVSVPTTFHRDWLDRRFGERLASAVRFESGEEKLDLRWLVEPKAFEADGAAGGLGDQERAARPGETGPDAGRRRAIDGGAFGGPAAPEGRHRGATSAGAKERRAESSRFRLEDFVVGPSNHLAYEAASRIGEPVEAGFGVLCIYGACGVGKTHLAQGIVRRYRARSSGGRARYTTGERFANEFIASIQGRGLDEFRRRYRGLDLLCIDDVHFLGGKRATQSEFLHTFETLELAGARVVLVSDEHPKLVTALSASIVSRCMSGMVVEVERPDRETRLRIAQRLAGRRCLSLEPEAVEAIASSACGSVRELEGAVTRVDAYVRLQGGRSGVVGVSASDVRRALEGAQAPVRRPVRLREIVQAACEGVGVEVSEVLGPGRHRRVVVARSLVSKLARELTSHSFPEIARALNRRNHSTVVTACNRVGSQMETGATVVGVGGAGPVRVSELYDRVRTALLAQSR